MNITKVGRYTFYYHLRAIALEGAFNGIWQMNDIVARKALHADNFWITLLVMTPAASLLLSVLWGPAIEGREKKGFFLLAGVSGRLLLALAAGVDSPMAFVGIVGSSAFAWSLLYPLQNAIYQANYTAEERGKLFGIGISLAAFTTMGSAMLAGRIYDLFPNGYRMTYPVAALLGFGSCFIFSRVRQRGLYKIDLAAVKNPIAGAWLILKKDRDFRLFELSFMLYGMAYMMMAPLIPIYLVDRLKVSYSQASFCKVVIYYTMMVICSWIWGRFSAKMHPAGVAALGFTGLSLFPLALGITRSPHHAYTVFAMFGLFMSAVEIAWTMGPIAFAGKRDAAAYMAVHVALAGVRALLGHPIGTVLLAITGSFWAPFCLASAFYLAGGLTAFALRKRIFSARSSLDSL